MKLAFLTNLLHTEDQHINIGDVFIGMGLKHLLTEAFKPEHVEFVMMSRFAKLTNDDLEKIKKCDFVVYAGMPQYNNLDDWKFYYDDEIWDDLNSTGVPILRLAGGGGYPSTTMTPEEFGNHLMSSEYTRNVLMKAMKNIKLVTTRDKMAQNFLEQMNVDSKLLPCSGTFATFLNNNGYLETDRKYNCICLTAAYLKNRDDVGILVNEFQKTKEFLEKRTGKPCYILGQVHRNDYEFLDENFKDVITFKKPLEVIDFYQSIDYCVTTRLHCALPLFGIGSNVVMIRVDSRGIAVEEAGIPVVALEDYKFKYFQEIFEKNKFSKENPQELINKSISFYKDKLCQIMR